MDEDDDHRDHHWEDFGKHLVFLLRCRYPGCGAWVGAA